VRHPPKFKYKVYDAIAYTPYIGTSPVFLQQEKIQISMIRRQSSAKKTSQMCSLSQSTRQLSRRAIKRANQTLSERELNLLFQYHRQLDICFGNGAKRISRNSYIGFGKSYLIPETTNFDIGEGIAFYKLFIWLRFG